MAKGNGNASMTPKVFRLLDEAFLDGASVVEAAIYAGISKTTLYDYIEAHSDYSERINAIKNQTGLRAKRNIRKEIEEGKIPISQWYLERRDDDYKPKQKQEVELSAHKSLIDAILESKKGCGK
jgi:hypothetical protein